MAMQLLVGVPLEMVHGAVRIGLVYVCGVLAGGHSLTHVYSSFIYIFMIHLYPPSSSVQFNLSIGEGCCSVAL